MDTKRNYKFDLNIVVVGKIKDEEFSKYFLQKEFEIYEIYKDKEKKAFMYTEHKIIKSWKFFFCYQMKKKI